MIEIPYWWDRKYESLQASIYSQRPDLFAEKPKGTPISTIEPKVTEIKQSNEILFYILIERYFEQQGINDSD